MNKARRYIIMTLLAAVAICGSAHAQRTMRGQVFVDLAGGWPVGAAVSGGCYTLPGYWRAGLEALRMREYLRLDGTVGDATLDVWQARAQGGYMYRLAAARSRVVSLYGGGTAWVGIESVDPLRQLPDDMLLSIDSGETFVFGATPRLEAELFLGQHVAILVGGQIPVAFLSRIRMTTLQATASLRLAF